MKRCCAIRICSPLTNCSRPAMRPKSCRSPRSTIAHCSPGRCTARPASSIGRSRTREVNRMNAPLGPVTAADIDAYCARIGYDGPLTPTLATLKALQALHPATIVFENMDVLLGKTVDLAPAALADKLLARGRGGYCFEQNTLFRHVLAGIGFAVESLMARVWWAVPEGTAYARTHMALRVTIDGVRWLCDVGFGGCVPTAPLRFDTQEAQATAHEDFRIVPSGDGLMLEARRGGAWLQLYELQERPQLDEDLEMMNWYTATFPD